MVTVTADVHNTFFQECIQMRAKWSPTYEILSFYQIVFVIFKMYLPYSIIVIVYNSMEFTELFFVHTLMI